ncbi:GPI-linked NAD(P)(+)--arginine ADP-ribosyltransferase 1-like [Clupea harengus]|uniref:NAD(P)(+)--arginine ADP-ribosyltransferase n=1 Tax=Clupea harengus TaxID=7950 RepID=A0A8M1K9G5_CLUHA|nr:GPI-linked NAD(P)(+)--arginine ADP-ribosyltransferase 1-like [Clupea harengus]
MECPMFFNNAVRTSRTNYKTTFKYHSLHFLSKDAIQRLNPNGTCLQVNRETRVEFKPPKLFRSIRFGSFTSTSVYPNNATKLGSKSCFEVWICHGANVSKYSQYPAENEVLIPPYEKFKIKKVIKNHKNQAAMKCETVYQLKSSGIKSSLRCALFKKASGAL